MNRWLKKHFPSRQSMKKNSNLKGLRKVLQASCFWSRDQQSIARGIAAGFAASLLPGIQFFYAAILVILLRGNLPAALVATLVTNPLTVVPITYFVYIVGTLILHNGKTTYNVHEFHWDFSSFHAFWTNVSAWMLHFGKAFFIGLPIVSIGFGLLGYFGTIFIWKIVVLCHKKFKHTKKK